MFNREAFDLNGIATVLALAALSVFMLLVTADEAGRRSFRELGSRQLTVIHIIFFTNLMFVAESLGWIDFVGCMRSLPCRGVNVTAVTTAYLSSVPLPRPSCRTFKVYVYPEEARDWSLRWWRRSLGGDEFMAPTK